MDMYNNTQNSETQNNDIQNQDTQNTKTYQTYHSDYTYNGAAGSTTGASGNSAASSPKKEKEKKSSGFFGKFAMCICLGLFFGLFAGVGFFGVKMVTGTLPEREYDEEEEYEEQDDKGRFENLVSDKYGEESKSGIKLTDTEQIRVVSSDVTAVVEETMPAMVSIVNNYTQTGTTIFGQTFSQDLASSGSGIIVAESDTELLIVSNHHVVSDADQLDVTFIDGTTTQALIKGLDSDMDLAVIAVSLESLTKETKEAIAIATLGDSDALVLGEPVIAIGNALGYGQSVTNGIVSALDRMVELENGIANTFIQTNAAINPGNSGGALLNVNGEVIGINSNKIGGTSIEGMGYAIPISAAKPIISDLMLKETRTKVEDGKIGYMGISMQTVPESYTQAYKTPAGVFVTEVEKGSPAAKAGLTYGDIIVKFEGEKISAYQDIQNIIQYYGEGSEVTVTVKRLDDGEYKTVEIKIVLGKRPDSEK